MARMHSRKKGKSGSKKPIKKTKNIWIRHTPQEIEKLITKLYNSGKTASQIGIILRDSYGIPDVKKVVGKKITPILKDNKIKIDIPEDLKSLIKKEIKILAHMENNKKDMPSKRGLQLTESKIRRLVKYYKKNKKLPSDWNYDRSKAKLLIG
jgi:small subunit ribosomal protein S15